MRSLTFALFAVFLLAGCQPPPATEGGKVVVAPHDVDSEAAEEAAEGAAPTSNWKAILAEELPKLGHRNWIVVADSAYPWQISPGVETVVTGADQREVVQAVLEAIKAAPHVQGEIMLDSELAFVPETEAPGVSAYRDALTPLFGDAKVTRLKHEEIIAKLDRVGSTFKVLLLKTTMTIPYTSVFIELNAGYWGPAQEAKLRDIIKAGAGAAPKPTEPKTL